MVVARSNFLACTTDKKCNLCWISLKFHLVQHLVSSGNRSDAWEKPTCRSYQRWSSTDPPRRLMKQLHMVVANWSTTSTSMASTQLHHPVTLIFFLLPLPIKCFYHPACFERQIPDMKAGGGGGGKEKSLENLGAASRDALA